MQIINDGNECPGCTLAKMLINLVLSQVLALVSATAQEMAYEGDLLEALKIEFEPVPQPRRYLRRVGAGDRCADQAGGDGATGDTTAALKK